MIFTWPQIFQISVFVKPLLVISCQRDERVPKVDMIVDIIVKGSVEGASTFIEFADEFQSKLKSLFFLQP